MVAVINPSEQQQQRLDFGFVPLFTHCCERLLLLLLLDDDVEDTNNNNTTAVTTAR